ncbi:MAG TPA: hypothetical protein VGE72_30000, partial [Azospirillum sp.]
MSGDTDLISLGIGVDTSAVRGATRDLDAMGHSARAMAGQVGAAEAACLRAVRAIETMLNPMRLLRDLAPVVGLGFATWKLGQLVQEATNLAARLETLDIVLERVGRSSGFTGRQVAEAAIGVQKMGITMAESRQTVIALLQAQLDLANATKLARIAQDAAVIGNLNSSQALNTLIHGIKTAQIDVLRTIGITVNFEQSYAKLAAQLNKAAGALSEQEKATARVNAVLEQGKLIAGAYEAAMGTASKQLQSMKRYVEDTLTRLGELFTPAFTAAVFRAADAMKSFEGWLTALKENGTIAAVADGLAAVVNNVDLLVVALGTVFAGRALAPALAGLAAFVANLVTMRAALGTGMTALAAFEAAAAGMRGVLTGVAGFLTGP